MVLSDVGLLYIQEPSMSKIDVLIAIKWNASIIRLKTPED